MNRREHPAIRVRRIPGGLRIRMPVKVDGFRALLNLVWFLACSAGQVAIGLWIFGEIAYAWPRPTAALLFGGLLLLAFNIAGWFVLWHWLWYMGGQETFEIARGALTARREIWGIGRSRTFGIGDILSVQARELKYRFVYPTWGRFFIGHGDSEVMIDHAGRDHAYGRGLEEGDAADLVAVLRVELDTQANTKVLTAAHAV